MSGWPSGPWKITIPGCDLVETDELTISDTDKTISVARLGVWGRELTYDTDTTAHCKAGDRHNLEYTRLSEKKHQLTCTFPDGKFGTRQAAGRFKPSRKRSRGKLSHQHSLIDHHTGGTVVSWTAEAGGD
jgi:hypothetical protein